MESSNPSANPPPLALAQMLTLILTFWWCGDICAERGITTSRSATPDTVARHVLRIFAATKPYTVKVRTVYYYYYNTDNIMLCRPSWCLSFRCSRPTCMCRHVFLHLFPWWRRTNTFVIIRFLPSRAAYRPEDEAFRSGYSLFVLRTLSKCGNTLYFFGLDTLSTQTHTLNFAHNAFVSRHRVIFLWQNPFKSFARMPGGTRVSMSTLVVHVQL